MQDLFINADNFSASSFTFGEKFSACIHMYFHTHITKVDLRTTQIKANRKQWLACFDVVEYS